MCDLYRVHDEAFGVCVATQATQTGTLLVILLTRRAPDDERGAPDDERGAPDEKRRGARRTSFPKIRKSE